MSSVRTIEHTRVERKLRIWYSTIPFPQLRNWRLGEDKGYSYGHRITCFQNWKFLVTWLQVQSSFHNTNVSLTVLGGTRCFPAQIFPCTGIAVSVPSLTRPFLEYQMFESQIIDTSYLKYFQTLTQDSIWPYNLSKGFLYPPSMWHLSPVT